MSNAKKIVPCVCGSPDTPNTIHRFDGPCYQQPTPPPASVPSAEGAELETPAIQHVVDILETKDRQGVDIEIGSTALKSLLRWSREALAVHATLSRERDELRTELEKANKLRLECAEMAEIGQSLLEIVEKHTLERDSSFEPEDVLTSHYSERDELSKQVEQHRATIAELEKEVVLLRAANSDARRIADEREAFRQSLADIIRIVEAMRYTAGLGKGQLERFEKAKALLARYSDALPIAALANADKQRLDRLEKLYLPDGYIDSFIGKADNLRAAIDSLPPSP